MKTFIKLASVIGLCFVCASQAMAVTQGTYGTDSTGIIGVDVNIPKIAKISGLSDLAQTFNGHANFDQTTTANVFTNTTSAAYTVNVTGANAYLAGTAGFYAGNNAGAQEVPMAVTWNSDTPGTPVLTTLASGVDVTGQIGTSVMSGGNPDITTPNAELRVVMTTADLLKVHTGHYTNTLTILITPE